MLCNPPQPEDADFRDEPDASAADDVAPSAGASVLAGATGADESTGVELPRTGDSEELSPFRVKRSRPSGAEDLDATSGVVPLSVPSAELSPSVAECKRPRFGRLLRARSACGG